MESSRELPTDRRAIGQPYAAHPDVAEDLHVRIADVAVAMFAAGLGEGLAELTKEASQQLTDGLAVGGQLPLRRHGPR